MTASEATTQQPLVAAQVEKVDDAPTARRAESTGPLDADARTARAAVRHRAPALSPDERRALIIAATQPLLQEYGVLVTTSQIAQAAGIAEGTIFRVFPDKRRLISDALHSAMCGDVEVDRIRQIPVTIPLAERLVAALSALADYQERFWALVRVFRETGWPADHDDLRSGAESARPVARIRAAMSELFAPEADALRMGPVEAARALLALAFGDRMTSHGLGEPSHTPEQLVDWFLDGVLARESRSNRDD